MINLAKHKVIFICFSALVFLAIAGSAYCLEDTAKPADEAAIQPKEESDPAKDSDIKPVSQDDAVASSGQQSAPADISSGLHPQYQTDISTGRATVSIPLLASPGRAGIQPNLS